ncbi:hypothetical protein O6H91_06G088000 [Diphasiastrum complanatum]|uniref:Uncharacterized protein n=1 Tax=Diphasiastrum complanatum TaxID=34168 RepID=A0ACC2DGF8_DIPCM|nr:hypothetical protein O6H91_06G088000 [Diphasiastrum complanatum]
MPTSVALSQFSDNSDTDYQGSECEDCGEMPAVGSQRGDGSNMTQSRAARLSTKRKKLGEVDDEALYSEVIQTIHEGADLETLTLKHCKAYIRAHGMRLTGSKAILLARIKEHLELKAGGLEAKYPRSSFVICCKGDACCGDVVLFHQTVYNKYSIVTRRAQSPPLGKRLIAGRVVSESYGARKQQHTFTIEVLWSSGVCPLTPMTQLIVKGRNLYRHNIFRQCWTNEDERKKVIEEKHARGDVARDTRALAKEKYWYKNNYVHQAKMKKRKREISSQGNTKERHLFENGLVKDSSNKPTSKSPEVNAGQKRWKAKSRHKNGVQGAPTKKRFSEGNSVLKTMSLLRMVNIQSASKHHMRNPKLGSVQLICRSSHCSNYASHKCSKKMCKPCCRKSGSICARHS